MDNVKLIPYGICHFKQVRLEGKYFADKTQYLPSLVGARRDGVSLYSLITRNS